MRLVIPIILSIIYNTTYGQDLEKSRQLLKSAYNSKVGADSLYNYFHKNEFSSAIGLGYKGVSEMMICKYIYNPYSKLSSFRKGKNNLENAIKIAPNDIELRYLRYAVQNNIPSILNYSNDVNSDKKILLDYINKNEESRKDIYLYNIIVETLKKTN